MTPCRYCGAPDAYDSGFSVECVSVKCGHYSPRHAADVLDRRAAPPAFARPEAVSAAGALLVKPERAEYRDTDSPGPRVEDPCQCGHGISDHALLGSADAPDTSCRAGGCLCTHYDEVTVLPSAEDSVRRRCCPAHAAREVLSSDRVLVFAGAEVVLGFTSMILFRAEYAVLWGERKCLLVQSLRIGCDEVAVLSVGGALPGECLSPERPLSLGDRLVEVAHLVSARVQNVSLAPTYVQMTVHGRRFSVRGGRFDDFESRYPAPRTYQGRTR